MQPLRLKVFSVLSIYVNASVGTFFPDLQAAIVFFPGFLQFCGILGKVEGIWLSDSLDIKNPAKTKTYMSSF